MFATKYGKKFHKNPYCAYLHKASAIKRTDREVTLADIAERELTACSHCAEGIATPAPEPKTEVQEDAYCTGRKFTHPKRIQSACAECGKVMATRVGGPRKHKK